MLSVFSEIRFAARALARDRTFSLTALATFALCVGANVAIFAVVDAVLLRPLPFREPDRLVVMFNGYDKAGVPRAGNSVPHFLERRAGLRQLSGLAALRTRDAIVGDAGRPERTSALRVTPDFFTVLAQPALLGRTFTAAEAEEGQENEVVLSYGYWQQQFGGAPTVLGQMLRIDGVPHTVIGVMPKNFRFAPAKDVRLWTPLVFRADERGADHRHSNNLNVIGRLAPGATLAQAQAEVDALNAKALETDPYRREVVDAGFHTAVVGLQADLTRNVRTALWLLQGGALLVLVIGAVNLANLLLVRANVRAKEMAIRRVLGAGAAGLAHHVFTENLLLAAVGGLIGIGVGAALLPALASLGLSQLPRGDEVKVDVVVAAGALAAALGTGALLAVAPLAQHLGGRLAAALSVESRGGTTTRRQGRIRETLIVAQIALAFVLLTSAVLLTLSFSRLVKVDPGFQPQHVLTAQVNLPRVRFKDATARRIYVQRAIREFSGVPGVASVALSTGAPFAGDTDSNVITAEDYTPAPGESLQAPFETAVAGDFFGAFGLPVREGRALNADDADAEAKVAVIDERFARRYWPGRSPVGHRIRNGTGQEKDTDVFTVVGVVGNVKQTNLAEPTNVGAVYVPYRWMAASSLVLTVRTPMAPTALVPMLTAAALRVDPEVPLFDVKTMTQRIDESLGSRRTPMVLAITFASVAIVLAIVGIYGVLAYMVAQRRREIGIRLALGAEPQQVGAMFLRLGLRLLIIGLLIGIPLSWWLGRLLRGELFGIEPANPWVLAAGVTIVAVAALAAAVVPARRAAAIPAMEALRAE